MKIAIVGAGPAGAHLAYLLGKSGCDVLLFDARERPWEKPCGGGVTTKALGEFDFLRGEAAPKQMVSSVRVITARGREVALRPKTGFAIYSRAELDRMMRARAVAAGAKFVCARVARIARGAGKWELMTQAGEVFACDFLVGADGATSKIRPKLGFDFAPQDFIYALGWHVNYQNGEAVSEAAREAASRVDIKYLTGATGYIWAFPRTDHLSYGIATKYRERNPKWLKETLLDFIEVEAPQTAREIKSADSHSALKQAGRATFYGAMIPALEPASWDKLKACDADKSWALVGDAAGFVDPLTGEGIYYAIKSAELLAAALLGRAKNYDAMWRAEFGEELRRAAELMPRFYTGHFAAAPVTERMVQLARFHRGIREVLDDLIAGTQGYVGLKRRLLKSAIRVV
jgi:geranylgeranyl reductase family protein